MSSTTGNVVSGQFDRDRDHALAVVDGDDVRAAVYLSTDATEDDVRGLLDDLRAELSLLTGGDLR